MQWIVGRELSFISLEEGITWDLDLAQYRIPLPLHLYRDQLLPIQAKEWTLVEHPKKLLII